MTDKQVMFLLSKVLIKALKERDIIYLNEDVYFSLDHLTWTLYDISSGKINASAEMLRQFLEKNRAEFKKNHY